MAHTQNHALGLLENEEERKIYGSGKEEQRICPLAMLPLADSCTRKAW